MKNIILFYLFLLASPYAFTQQSQLSDHNSQKGKMYFYWGWNRSLYSKSDITFTGADYGFEIKNVIAKDRQSVFGADPYLNPARATIPQYNFRLGYFISNHWDISFGIDHMKYVVQDYQTVKISVFDDSPLTPYEGVYNDYDISTTSDFLLFEHTDGLNYINLGIRRSDNIVALDWVAFNLTEGIGAGALYPKTNTTLFRKERYDEFHWSGYSFDVMVGINAKFFDVFFIQSELKGGYVNMPNIRTTNSTDDKASQSFFFGQINILFGGIIHLSPNSKRKQPTN